MSCFTRVSQKVLPFSLVQETCIIHQNEAGPMWITSFLLNIVTISLNSNVPLSNESIYPCVWSKTELAKWWYPPSAWQWSTTHRHQDKRDNHLIWVDNFTASSILTRFSAFSLLSHQPHEREFKRQTLCQWWGSENCSDEIAQRTVNRILRGRDTCSYSKVEHDYWEKWWLCWEVWFT